MTTHSNEHTADGSFVRIHHDGGSHLVEAEINPDGTATIYFGASFTLRLDEDNLDQLRRFIHSVSRDLMVDSAPCYPGWPNVPLPETPEVRDTLNAWADEKEDYKHLLDLTQCSEV